MSQYNKYDSKKYQPKIQSKKTNISKISIQPNFLSFMYYS